MTQSDRKMSEIMKEMSEQLLRRPDAYHSSEAAHVALMFANIAWNESVGSASPRENYRSAWEAIEAENPALWKEFKSTNVEAMLNQLVAYKKQHFPHDRRRILTCGIPNGNIRVEWLAPAAPGVDSRSELQLFALVRMGERKQAVKLLQSEQGLSRSDAVKRVKRMEADFGMI